MFSNSYSYSKKDPSPKVKLELSFPHGSDLKLLIFRSGPPVTIIPDPSTPRTASFRLEIGGVNKRDLFVVDKKKTKAEEIRFAQDLEMRANNRL